jgi:hypothetical protein
MGRKGASIKRKEGDIPKGFLRVRNDEFGGMIFNATGCRVV